MTVTIFNEAELTSRQQRELDYHRDHAERHEAALRQPVGFKIVKSRERRWYNAYWETYRLVLSAGLTSKRVLVVGCGAGTDAIRLAAIGAEAFGCDLSPDLISIATERAKAAGLPVDFRVMPAERLDYADRYFDAVLFVDILHHVDIPKTMQEIRRVLKPGALVIGDELYTHTAMQRVRASRLVTHGLYPRMVRFIYGTDRPYITEDERKIDEREFASITDDLRELRCDYFSLIAGRLVPDWIWACKLDRLILMAVGSIGRFLAGRVVFMGRVP